MTQQCRWWGVGCPGGEGMSKPKDLVCEFCREGECDVVALNMGWCGTARLLAAIDAHPLGDSDNGPSRGGPHTSNGGDQ